MDMNIYEPERIRKIYRVVLSMGDGEISYPAIGMVDGKPIHYFDQLIELVLNELDTTPDFIQYLEAREALFVKADGPT